MLVTREMDYAVRAIHALEEGGQLSAAAVAEREEMPQAVALKILKRLSAAGIVESRRGAGGGYRLTPSAREMSLYDLLRVFGKGLLLNRCQESGYRCENHPDGDCGVCRELCRIQAVLDAELRRTPLREIFQGSGSLRSGDRFLADSGGE